MEPSQLERLISEGEIEEDRRKGERRQTTEERLDEGDKRFARIETVLERLQVAVSENTELTKTVAGDTEALRNGIAEAVAAKKLLCRLAAVWRFVFRYIFLPIGIACVAFYMLVYYLENGDFPHLLVALVKAFL